jgi:hypothetical protein
MLFLPNYYGVVLSDSLPVISVTRIMFMIFYVYAILNRRRSLHIETFSIKRIPQEHLLLAGYFVLRIVSNVYYITTYGQAIKTIFEIVFEQLLFLIAIYLLNPSKGEVIKLIKTIVSIAVVLFMVGIFESISGVRIFDALYTVSRSMLNLKLMRLGLLRATTTMYMPGFFGNMCVLVLPLIFFLYEETHSFKYILASLIDVIAVIHSGARSDMLFIVVITISYLLFVLKIKESRLLFLRNVLIVVAALLVYVMSASFFSDNLRYFYIGNGKAVLNEIGFDFDLNEGAPSGTGGYGNNANGTVSRTRQFTGMYYVAKINPIFGLGSGAQARGDIHYYWRFSNGKDDWRAITVYDLGIVEIFCDEGLIGLLGIISLLLYLLIKAKNKNYYLLLILCYLLSTLNTSNMYPFFMLYVMLISRNDLTCDAFA